MLCLIRQERSDGCDDVEAAVLQASAVAGSDRALALLVNAKSAIATGEVEKAKRLLIAAREAAATDTESPWSSVVHCWLLAALAGIAAAQADYGSARELYTSAMTASQTRYG